MIKVAGGIRKSPTNESNHKSQIDTQKLDIINFYDRLLGKDQYKIEWFIDDHIKGDDPRRPELIKFFKKIKEFTHMCFQESGRYSRSWLGIKWFMTYFATEESSEPHKGCKLHFTYGIPDLYTAEDMINHESFNMLFIQCGQNMYELMKSRAKQEAGRQRIRKNPDEWNEKYQGRKKGSKNVSKMKHPKCSYCKSKLYVYNKAFFVCKNLECVYLKKYNENYMEKRK